MCFRPADASAGAEVSKCLECGKAFQVMNGFALSVCPFCKSDFISDFEGEEREVLCAVLSVPEAPAVPKPPAV